MVGLVKVSPTGIDEGKATINGFNNLFKIKTNPFLSSTKITYLIDSPGASFLKIYDVLGNQIRTFNFNSTKPGWHSVTWNGKNDKNQIVTSGIYFCRLILDSKEITRKLLKLQ